MANFGQSFAKSFVPAFQKNLDIPGAIDDREKRERLNQAAELERRKMELQEFELDQKNKDRANADMAIISSGAETIPEEGMDNYIKNTLVAFPTDTDNEFTNRYNQYVHDTANTFKLADKNSRGNLSKTTAIYQDVIDNKLTPTQGISKISSLLEVTKNRGLKLGMQTQLDALQEKITGKRKQKQELDTFEKKEQLKQKLGVKPLEEKIVNKLQNQQRQERLIEKLADSDVKILENTRERGIQASTQLGEIQAQRELLDAKGFDTGALEGIKNVVGNVLTDLGLPRNIVTSLITNVEAGDAFQAIANGRVLDKATLLKGNTSDRDIKFVVKSMENLGNTEAGNRLLLDYLESAAVRAIDKAVFLEEALDSDKSLSQANRDWATFVRKTPTIKRITNPKTGDEVYVSIETFKNRFPDMDEKEVLDNWRKL